MQKANRGVSYKKDLYYILCIIAVIIIFIYSIWGPEGYLELRKLRQGVDSQRMRVKEIEGDNQQRMNYIKALKSDRATIESHARQKGYVKENELIYQVPE
jgi:cell division protein FtsB